MIQYMIATLDGKRAVYLTNDDGFFTSNFMYAKLYNDVESAQKDIDNNMPNDWGRTYFLVAID